MRLAQLGRRFLTLANGWQGSGRREPAREQFFAQVGTGERQQLKQRSWTEDVEIAGVEVILREESRAGLSDVVPAILEA
jgi:hypothetical protein